MPPSSLASASEINTKGTLYGIGVGPGDPELLTVKAVRILSQAKIIAYAAPLANDGAGGITSASMARAIASRYFPPDIIEYPIHLPMVVDRAPAQQIYQQAAMDFRQFLQKGEDVVVLCQGDPMFYGSFMYLLPHVQPDFKVEIVPGVSSLMAASAGLIMPLVERNQTLSVVPGPSDNEILRQIIAVTDTTAILKIGRHFPRIRALLSDMGLLDQSYYIERASQIGEKYSRLADISDECSYTAPYFAMILVKKPMV
ncbi:MAG: precorrin-2 C(20)-methyltransferase [Alphaproteobacteria bacterium]|nr:precorrin-2 C(20)-methyltransferase [Alphaproteobacteria bacterium]